MHSAVFLSIVRVWTETTGRTKMACGILNHIDLLLKDRNWITNIQTQPLSCEGKNHHQHTNHFKQTQGSVKTTKMNMVCMNKYSKWNVNTFNVYTELWFGHMLTFPRLSTTLDLVALMIPLWFPTGFGLYPFNHFCRACMIDGDMSGSRTITLDKPSYHSWPALIPKPNQWLRNCVEPPLRMSW